MAKEPSRVPVGADKVIRSPTKDVDKPTNKNEGVVSPSDTSNKSHNAVTANSSFVDSPSSNFSKQQHHISTGRTKFNIITGRPLQTGANSNNSLFPPTHSSLTLSHTSKTSATPVVIPTSSNKVQPEPATGRPDQPTHKAPYLDMRYSNRNKFQLSSSFHSASPPRPPQSLSTYRASFKPMTGFSMDSAVNASAGGVNPWQSNSATLRYSKHSSLPQHGTRMAASSAPQGSGIAVPTGSNDPLSR